MIRLTGVGVRVIMMLCAEVECQSLKDLGSVFRRKGLSWRLRE